MIRDAGGSRTRLKPLCRRLPGRLAPASFASPIKCPRQESNLVFDLRRVACIRHTPRTIITSTPPRNRTSSCSFERCRALRHTRKALCYRNIPTWTRTRAWTFGESDAIRYTIGIQFIRADDWICTSISRFTEPEPFYVEPRRQARVRGVEPREAVLEAACSPRSTLV
jgi:hypothetical protein